ncbi:hypothetical protein AKJ09_09301 [Labilithrix luteola]|uniref:DUF4395 domain-containing protein n=1 Tax=Labilithrix luteola TaxID=1391654 RepID=A0A0K1QA79_9BACT|nr:DUF4395 family protein [Labilithrix luteola]AKV02638.1 hypothetical protein AKJ09_09301 [Labilithrix luteola]
MTSRFTERNLDMQGFACETDASIAGVAPWLRLTPSLSTAWIVTGTALASPAVLFCFSLTSAFGASRREHPFDRLYNRGLRRITKTAPLPANPPPRRFAMGLAAAWAATAAALFATGHKRTGRIAGGLLGLAGATVASTHFCLGSFVYRQLEKLPKPRRGLPRYPRVSVAGLE